MVRHVSKRKDRSVFLFYVSSLLIILTGVNEVFLAIVKQLLKKTSSNQASGPAGSDTRTLQSGGDGSGEKGGCCVLM